MANIIEHRKFVFCRAGNEDWQKNGSNKVWEIILYDNDDVETFFGKIGTTLQSNLKSGAGRKFFDKKIKEKTTPSDHYDGECYREIKTLDTKTSSVSVSTSKSSLKEIAKKQIASCPITSKLIEYFTDVNVHQIAQISGGKITYDTSTGTFKTPVGIVVQENINEARELLHNTLVPFVVNKDFRNIKFIRSLEDYLMLIPKDIGRSFDAEAILGTQEKVQEQESILDSLEATIKSVMANPVNKKDEEEDVRIFDIKMNLINDNKEITRIQDKFDSTRQNMHSSSRLKIKNAYSISINTMTSNYNKYGAKMPNIWELWHGTKASNCLSILKCGFIIPPSNASYCTGRMFGNGVYFSDQSTKSLNYAMSYWGGRDEGRYFMFLNQVAMGNYYTPSNSTSSLPPKGYDSYFAKAGKSSVMNNEMIVFNTSQINPTHLIEFGK